MSDVSANSPFPISVRKRSGAARSISAWTAFLFGVHCISLSSSGLIPYSWVASVWPGASILGVLTIAMVFCLIHAAAYSIIGATVPQEGGDYVFASRVVSSRLAFAASLTMVLFSGIVAGGLAAWVPNTALPSLLRPMSIIFQNPAYADLADYASSGPGTIAIGGLIVAFSALTTLHAGTLLKTILTAGFFLGIIAWAIILWSFYSADGPETFRTAWDHFMATTGPFGAFDKRVPLAMAAGMSISHSVWQMTLAGLIMGFWIYYGYFIPVFFAEEVKRPKVTLVVASVAALLIAYLIFAAGAILLQRLVPDDWIAAEGFLSNNRAAVTKAAGGTPVVAMPWITFYAAIVKPVPILIVIVAFCWLFTLINLVQTYLFYTSRIIISWAQDQIIPDWFLGKHGDPSFSRALIVTSALAFIGLADSASGGLLGTQLTFAFFAVVTKLVPIFALTFLANIRWDLFEQLPDFLKRRFIGIPVASWIAGVALIHLAWMATASFLFPGAGVANPLLTLALLLVFVLGGVVIFSLMRRKRMAEGIDIDRIYQTLGADGDPR